MDGNEKYTKYVTTPWYRAPEILLNTLTYALATDIVIGSLTEETWEKGLYHAQEVLNFAFLKRYHGVDKLVELGPNVDEDAISLIRCLCSWDDLKRPTTMEALQHPFFANHYTVPKSIATCGPSGRHNLLREGIESRT
ncbi:hypothetical protein Sjap_004785 [Stephania japonica]|uniref:Protein kinase domain-containing protein n=1 Tax=Stephania japonica TaxID=461633 RepID=A0AAP0K2Y1_9MAGN